MRRISLRRRLVGAAIVAALAAPAAGSGAQVTADA